MKILENKKQEIHNTIDFLVGCGYNREIAFLNNPEEICDKNDNIIGFIFSSTISNYCKFSIYLNESISFFDVDFLEVSKEFKEIRDNYLAAKYPNIKK